MPGEYKFLHFWFVETTKGETYKITPKQHDAILYADQHNARFVELDGRTQNVAFIESMKEKRMVLSQDDIDQGWSSFGLSKDDRKFLVDTKNGQIQDKQLLR